MKLRARLVLLLACTAAGALALALGLQQRALERDLRAAAADRLAGAAHAAGLLVEQHLEALHMRYAAVSGTPQLRATLEVDDRATLEHYAEQLRQRQGAARIAFLSPSGRPLALAGALPGPALDPPARAGLQVFGARLHAVVSVALLTSGEPVGRLVAWEALTDDTLDSWSELCGAHIVFGEREPEEGTLQAEVGEHAHGALRVELSLAPEREALANARRQLLWAGVLSLLAATGLSFVLARGIAGPIQRLRSASRRIGAGDLDVRVDVDRGDELGDLAASLNDMARGLARHEAELRLKNAALRTATLEAEAANRAKTDFLANVSHEIRTPMTAILGFTELLLEEESDPDTRAEWGDSVRSNGQQLMALINSVLELSRIEAGRVSNRPEPCELSLLLHDVAASLRPRAEARGLELHCQAAAGISLEVDPTQLRRILVELLENAIKFTETGRVDLRLADREADAASGVRVEVRDTGVGIEPEQLEGVFGAFAQADTSASRGHGGTGLGLAIARGLAEAMGAELSASSEPGCGSCFALQLPLPVALRAPEPAPSEGAVVDPASLCGRVLVVEDCPSNQRLIDVLLRATHLDVEFANDGSVGCERALAELEDGDPFDLILMDMQMPILDGYAATRRLRAAGYDRPIVALTAHALPHDLERCMRAGCDAYATKPIDRERLLRVVRRHLADDAKA